MKPPMAHRRYLPDPTKRDPPLDTFATLLIGGAALVALFVLLFVLLPVMTS